MQLVTPGIGLVFWMTLSFLIVLFLLKKFAWKPILASLKEREESIEEALNSAENAREQMANIKAENDKILAQAKIERDGILKDAKEVKDQIIGEAKKAAIVEASKIIDNARAEIISEKEKVISEIKAQMAILSVNIAEKIIKTELSSENKKEELIDSYVKDIKLN